MNYTYEEIDKDIIAIDIGRLYIDKCNIDLIKDKNIKFEISTSHNSNKKTLYEIIINKNIPNSFIDHINNDSLDNRKTNLRECTCQQNSFNTRPRKGTSKYKGVSWQKTNKKWVSTIHKDYKKYHIGSFYTEEDAAKEYDKKAIELFGEYAYLNFPVNNIKVYNSDFIYIEKENNVIEIDFGKVIIDKEFLNLFLSKRWYVTIKIDRKKRLHSTILKSINKKQIIDHIDCNSLNNLLSNLRLVTKQENSWNSPNKINSYSGYKGVSYSKKENKYIVNIIHNNKSIYLGRYPDKKKAAQIYDLFCKYFRKEYCYLNLPNDQLDVNIEEYIKKISIKNKHKNHKYIGVYKHYNKWRTIIKSKYIGAYNTELEAVIVYNIEAEKLGLPKNIIEED